MAGHPLFTSLPPVEGRPDLRYVNGVLMDQRTYDEQDWVLMGTYTTDAGKPGAYWAQSYAGINRASEAARQRIVAARTRRESDDEWSRHIEQIVERTP